MITPPANKVFDKFTSDKEGKNEIDWSKAITANATIFAQWKPAT